MAKKIVISIFYILLAVNFLIVGYYLLFLQENPFFKKSPAVDTSSQAEKETALEAQSVNGRNKTYKNAPGIKYSKIGLITKFLSDRYLVEPLPYGQVFFVSKAEAGRYKEPEYKVHYLKGGKQMDYTLGYFDSWKETVDASDKIIVLRHPEMSTLFYEYIVSLKASDKVEEHNLTRLAVEDTIKLDQGLAAQAEEWKQKLREAADETWDKILKKGDVVIVLPALDNEGQVIKDEQETIHLGWIIIRRAGGLETLLKEVV